MNENEKKPGDWKMILGGIVLIVVLFVCIKFVFWGLGEVISKPPADPSRSTSVSQGVSSSQEEREAPAFCVHCGKELPESFQWGQFCPWCGEKNER